ncbi:MAG: DUF4870 domain-containing protein [Planctomycetota bacterium]
MFSNELERLTELYREGALTEEEFATAKQKVLNSEVSAKGSTDTIFGVEPKVWCILMHLTQVVWWMGGVVVGIAMWLLSRDKSVMADRHGRVIVNWYISFLIYSVISAILLVVLIGWPMGLVLGVLSVVFPIIGAWKASEGRVWRYPLSIEFFSTAIEPRAEQL